MKKHVRMLSIFCLVGLILCLTEAKSAQMGALNNGRSGSKFMTKTNLTANSSVTSIAPTGVTSKQFQSYSTVSSKDQNNSKENVSSSKPTPEKKGEGTQYGAVTVTPELNVIGSVEYTTKGTPPTTTSSTNAIRLITRKSVEVVTTKPQSEKATSIPDMESVCKHEKLYIILIIVLAILTAVLLLIVVSLLCGKSKRKDKEKGAVCEAANDIQEQEIGDEEITREDTGAGETDTAIHMAENKDKNNTGLDENETVSSENDTKLNGNDIGSTQNENGSNKDESGPKETGTELHQDESGLNDNLTAVPNETDTGMEENGNGMNDKDAGLNENEAGLNKMETVLEKNESELIENETILNEIEIRLNGNEMGLDKNEMNENKDQLDEDKSACKETEF